MQTPAMPEKSAVSSDEMLRPTYAPISMAMGIAMTAWGLVALSLNINAVAFMSVAGIALSSWALKSWIHEIVLTWEGPQ